MAKNVIETYSKKAQEILTKYNAELQKLQESITAQEGVISQAEDEMEKAMEVADESAWKKANAKKHEAEDSIEWNKRRAQVLKDSSIIDAEEYSKVKAEIGAQQEQIHADAAAKARELLSQAEKILADAESDIRAGNGVLDVYAKQIVKSESPVLGQTGNLAGAKAHIGRAVNALS